MNGTQTQQTRDAVIQSQTDVRPCGETEAEFMARLSGKKVSEMTMIDWQRFCSYEYLADGPRRQRLIDCGLGTIEQRVECYWKCVEIDSAR